MRVVVTGLGTVTPIGTGRQEFWTSLLEERCGFTDVASFDTSRYKVHRGSEVHGFEPTRYVHRQDPDSMGRTSQLAIAAARLSLDDAGLDAESYPPQRAGVCMGTTSGEPLVIEQLDDCIVGECLGDSDPLFFIPLPVPRHWKPRGQGILAGGREPSYPHRLRCR